MTPLLQEFNPKLVPWQFQAISFYNSFDYSNGILEMLMSGSIGSAKSICAAHLIALHAIKNEGSRQLVLRRALKDLKRTLWQTLISHIADVPQLIKEYNKSEMRITFANGSEIIGDSYDKGDLEKFRSLELSGVTIEEASESNKELYDAIKMRVGRLNKIEENYVLCLTNPDEPSHYLYKEFIEKESKNKKVFYSLTEQNPFLPKWYIENLRNDLDPMMAKRMLQGQWISIQGQTPYYAYDTNKQFLKNKTYKINPGYPLDFFHDFNIGEGKAMSSGYGQVINGVFHIGKSFVVEGFNTEQIVDEMIEDGCLEEVLEVRIFGDRNGKNNDTRSSRTDYDIIMKKLQNYRKKNGVSLSVKLQVPNENPPVRSRQNIVNAHCLNENGDVRLYVYKEAAKVDEGFRLTKIKKGSSYQEDDNNDYQHIVSAIGYYIYYYKNSTEKIGSLRPFVQRR
jgi:hypothetical protein